tara:strand:- start:676 stop:1281 length:606 start_codon:yes stop_codon:yes gene_type:complete
MIPMKRSTFVLTVSAMALALAGALSLRAQTGPGDAPRYVNGTDLVLPADYRTWTFIGAGIGMTYEGEGGAGNGQMFSNAFVNPSSHEHFMETGTWPDGTTFVLEFRQSDSAASINQAGRFQTELAFLEAEVKDSRFEDGWAFYQFGPGGNLRDVAPRMTGDAVEPCIKCHTEHTAVERTFVQFYPTLLEVAREKGTLKPGF